MLSQPAAGWKNAEKNSIIFKEYSTDNDGKGPFRVYRAGTVHCEKSAKRPNNVGQTREVRGQRKPQMCGLTPPERTSGPLSDVSDLSRCFSSLVVMSLWRTLIFQNSCEVWKNDPNNSRKVTENELWIISRARLLNGSSFKVGVEIFKSSFGDECSCQWFDLCLGLLSCSRRVLACDEVSLSNMMKHSRLSLPKD